MNLLLSIFELFPTIKSYFKAEQLKLFLNCSYEELHLYHFGLGTKIRNELLNSKEIIKQFNDCGIYCKDEMSSLIINLFYIVHNEQNH